MQILLLASYVACGVLTFVCGWVAGASRERVRIARRIMRWQAAGHDWVALAVWEDPPEDQT